MLSRLSVVAVDRGGIYYRLVTSNPFIRDVHAQEPLRTFFETYFSKVLLLDVFLMYRGISSDFY